MTMTLMLMLLSSSSLLCLLLLSLFYFCFIRSVIITLPCSVAVKETEVILVDDLDTVVQDLDAPPIPSAASTPRVSGKTSANADSSATPSTHAGEGNSRSKVPFGVLDALLRQHLINKGIKHDAVCVQGIGVSISQEQKLYMRRLCGGLVVRMTVGLWWDAWCVFCAQADLFSNPKFNSRKALLKVNTGPHASQYVVLSLCCQ